ncbi:MAG: hypothetical protein PVI41_11400, partial [Roseobacter sp.]
IDLCAKQASETFGWHVTGEFDGQQVQSDIEVLTWSDIVQQSRPHSVLTTYRDLIRTAWIYVSTGALFRLMLLRKGPVLAALYPVVALIGQAFLAVLLGWVTYNSVTLIGSEIRMPRAVQTVLAVGSALLIVAITLRWFHKHDGRFFAYYLMHDFAYSAALLGAYPDDLEARLRAFRQRLAAALQDEVDEVLLVGHSSGAYLGVSVLADLIRTGSLPANGPALGFLSLGQVVPMVSFLPRAERLRGDLRLLSASSAVTWVDVTAPGDGCCFALCDPVAVSGQTTPEKRGPLVFSAAFTQSLSPARWKALRWRFFRLHFQYLCAFDRPKDYDYFQITAGPLTLAERYAGRAPSRSRLEKSLSKYTSVRT